MRLQTPAWLVGGLAVLLGVWGASGQGSFQNLGFESASIVPIPGDPYARVQFVTAFPGWTGSEGGVQLGTALYNSWFLDSSGISIMDHGWPSTLGGLGGNACKLNCLDWEDFLLGGSILIAGSR